MNTAEEHEVEDAIFNLRHGYPLSALAVLEHLQEQSRLTHAPLVSMKLEVPR